MFPNCDAWKQEHWKPNPYGFLVGHSWLEVGIVFAMIDELKIKKFVEIGLHKGGLAALISQHCLYNNDFRYLGVEINQEVIEPKILATVRARAPRADIWVMDAHAHDTVELIGKWISGNLRPALIYCDGGHKPTEFGHYAQQLRPGDYIAAHDWDYGGYGRAEIKPADVLPVVEAHKLIPYHFGRPIRICLYRKPL